jgi:tRNA threonylcarbamoyladenosine biosynthesis protein TsaE
METYTIPEGADLTQVVNGLLTHLPPRGPAVIALSGDLGAGKTTLVQAVADAVGVHETVTSPTFGIMNLYPIEYQCYTKLVHIDAYRIEDESEIAPLRLEEIILDTQNLLCIEWPERIQTILPVNCITVEVIIGANKVRTFAISRQVVADVA